MRQLQKCRVGDAYRARIIMYPITQALAYYTVALLFGWQVVCVSYDTLGNVDYSGYEKIIQLLKQTFGSYQKHNNSRIYTCRHNNNHDVDMTDAMSVGIYK
jgi:hypothetical protein